MKTLEYRWDVQISQNSPESSLRAKYVCACRVGKRGLNLLCPGYNNFNGITGGQTPQNLEGLYVGVSPSYPKRTLKREHNDSLVLPMYTSLGYHHFEKSLYD